MHDRAFDAASTDLDLLLPAALAVASGTLQYLVNPRQIAVMKLRRRVGTIDLRFGKRRPRRTIALHLGVDVRHHEQRLGSGGGPMCLAERLGIIRQPWINGLTHRSPSPRLELSATGTRPQKESRRIHKIWTAHRAAGCFGVEEALEKAGNRQTRNHAPRLG
jgi:hypothetical protein